MGFEVDDLYSLPESAKSRVLPTTVPYNYKRLWHFPTETTAPKSHKNDHQDLLVQSRSEFLDRARTLIIPST